MLFSWAWLIRASTTKVSFDVLSRQGAGPTLVSVAACKVYGQFSHFHDQMGPALLHTTRGKGKKKGRDLSLTNTTKQ